MKPELMAAEETVNLGDRREALHLLGEYLKAEGAVTLGREVERASRGSVGGFSLDDIQAMGTLDEVQAELVMEELANDFDAEMGMNWEQIQDTIDQMFPGARAQMKV